MKIRVEYIGADNVGDHRHAQTIMSDLGIKYGNPESAPIGDCWVFHDVDPATVPAELPEYVVVLDEEEIGEGEEMSEALQDGYRKEEVYACKVTVAGCTHRFKVAFTNDKFTRLDFDFKDPYSRNEWKALLGMEAMISEIETRKEKEREPK